MGDGQRVRHRVAPRHDRHPRLDARHRSQRRPDIHALHASSTRRPTASGSSRRRAGTRAGSRSAAGRGTRASPATTSRCARRRRARVRLRGLVRFQWRRAGRVVRREVRATEAGHPRRRAPIRASWSRARLRRRRGDEQPRVVRDDAVDPERRRGCDDRRVVDGPDVELAAGAEHGAHERGRHEAQCAMTRVDLAGRGCAATTRGSAGAAASERRAPRTCVRRRVVGSLAQLRDATARGGCPARARGRRAGSERSVELTSERSSRPWRAGPRARAPRSRAA